MKLLPRIIPTLLLKDNGLVKGEKFKGHNYVGDPINAVKIYNDKGVDELCLLNITKEFKDPIPFDLIESIATEAFMPFSYGGNISNLDQIKQLISLGVEKIVLNTAAIENPNLIKQAADYIGSSSVTLSVDYKKDFFGRNRVYSSKQDKLTNIKVKDLCIASEKSGVGEVILCSVDREGTYLGYDIETIKDVSSSLSVPVIASGGASSIHDFKDAITNGASAAAAGNLFIYRGKYKAVMISYPPYEEIQSLF